MDHSSADPKTRFSSRVESYVAARPHYPPQVIPHLRDAIGLRPDWTIADLGSGTGISALPFLQNGNAVIGIEPNAAMRSAAEASLRAFANFRSLGGSAEATTLPPYTVDLIVAAQAFHWFDIEAARAESLRILRPVRIALLMWNQRQLGGTPFLESYEQLLLEHGTDYVNVRHENITDAHRSRFFGPRGYSSASFPNEQHLDWEGLRARLLSSSYVPQDHPGMLEHLRRIFDAHQRDGHVTILYQTELYYGPLE